MITTLEHYKQKVEHLERELAEMTIALSQAWDQLVPFLQEAPARAASPQDIVPILQAVAAAADTQQAAVYLFQTDEWFSVPETMQISDAFKTRLRGITQETIVDMTAQTGFPNHWMFAPVISEEQIIGLLGTGTDDAKRTFTAVDLRIVKRMAERIGSLMAAAQLALIREREAVMAREMEIANDIQQSVQPDAPPDTSRIKMGTYWRPAKKVGGDAWGWVQQPDGRLAWFILDVAGKGLPAALAAVSLHTAITMALRMRLSPVEALRVVNEAFYDPYTRTDLMATAAILAFNPETGVLEIANAGHPPILIRHQGTWLRLTATVPPIGVLPSLRAESQVLTLKPSDLIICYSDGFTEIQRTTGLWGLTGLLNTIPGGAKNVVALTNHIVEASRRAGPVEDDQTLITVLYTQG